MACYYATRPYCCAGAYAERVRTMKTSNDAQLRMPGPTPLPAAVRKACSDQMISHRSPEFAQLYREIEARLAPIFGTHGDVFILTVSGTGGMEACVANTLSPGDKVLAVSIGVFGDRFAEIARVYGADVIDLAFPLGQAADPTQVAQALQAHPDCRVVLVTHNETSTAVTNDMAAISQAVAASRSNPPLLVVDAVSSFGAIPCHMDQWCCDMMLTASQKACMAPPGLSMIAVGPRAWPIIEQARSPRFYLDLRAAKKYADRDNTPYTPAVSAFYGLRQALELMEQEGLEAIYARHGRVARKLRQGLQALGYELVADEAHASDSITAVYFPTGVTGEAFMARLATAGLSVGGGQGALKGKAFRIAHMGYVSEAAIDVVLEMLDRVR